MTQNIEDGKENAFNGHLKCGKIHLDKKNYMAAISDFTKAIDLYPESDSETCYLNRGIAYAYWGEFDRAIFDLNKVIKLSPNSIPAFYLRGLIYKAKGQTDKMLLDFEIVEKIYIASKAGTTIQPIKNALTAFQMKEDDRASKRIEQIINHLAVFEYSVKECWDVDLKKEAKERMFWAQPFSEAGATMILSEKGQCVVLKAMVSIEKDLSEEMLYAVNRLQARWNASKFICLPLQGGGTELHFISVYTGEYARMPFAEFFVTFQKEIEMFKQIPNVNSIFFT